MTRLIDADALIDEVDGDLTDGIAERKAIEKIKNAPTVDAIPVEWIRKYTEENRLYQSDDFDFYISDMIADWAERKEE